jgi:hypothetical protein
MDRLENSTLRRGGLQNDNLYWINIYIMLSITNVISLDRGELLDNEYSESYNINNLNVWQHQWLVTVAARSKARTVFSPSNTGIVASNPTQGMDICVCVYSVFVLFCG